VRSPAPPARSPRSWSSSPPSSCSPSGRPRGPGRARRRGPCSPSGRRARRRGPCSPSGRRARRGRARGGSQAAGAIARRARPGARQRGTAGGELAASCSVAAASSLSPARALRARRARGPPATRPRWRARVASAGLRSQRERSVRARPGRGPDCPACEPGRRRRPSTPGPELSEQLDAGDPHAGDPPRTRSTRPNAGEQLDASGHRAGDVHLARELDRVDAGDRHAPDHHGSSPPLPTSYSGVVPLREGREVLAGALVLCYRCAAMRVAVRVAGARRAARASAAWTSTRLVVHVRRTATRS